MLFIVKYDNNCESQSAMEVVLDVETRENSYRDSHSHHTQISNPLISRHEIRSSRRLRYEAEVQVIQKEIGGLEEIRGRLGLSRRKMTELLLVDPSAWTRWLKPGNPPPPHIFRMLEWYLMIKKEHASLAHQFYERRPVEPTQKSNPWTQPNLNQENEPKVNQQNEPKVNQQNEPKVNQQNEPKVKQQTEPKVNLDLALKVARLEKQVAQWKAFVVGSFLILGTGLAALIAWKFR